MSWISKPSTGNVFTMISIVIALIALTHQIFFSGNSESTDHSNKKIRVIEKSNGNAEITLFEKIGVKVILTTDKKTWKEIISYGISSYKENSLDEIVNARTIATIRAKSNLAHFLNEEINSKITLKMLSTQSEDVNDIITSITNTSHIIIKGIEILGVETNTSEKIISVKARIKNYGV